MAWLCDILVKIPKCREQSWVRSKHDKNQINFICRHTDDSETGDIKQQEFYDFVGRRIKYRNEKKEGTEG